MHTNNVELAGVVEDVRGGQTKNGGLWLLIRVRVTIDDYETTFPVWWFGKERQIYRGVKEGATIRTLGYLKWGKDQNDDWELKIIAQVVSLEEEEEEEERPARRNARNGRNGNGRNGNGRNGNGRKKAEIEEEEEEAPF